MKKYIFALLLIVLTVSCTKALYDYKDYDDAAYTYAARESDSDVKNIAKSYQSIVGEKEQKRKSSKFDPYRIPPGACADYGYLLLRQKDS
ncbi:MAG: DUF4810 domain-containing protein, partial [Bacteroidales bacterium]|nr:DUF4810 domain-containing protein [Bacteroidales bacterium]